MGGVGLQLEQTAGQLVSLARAGDRAAQRRLFDEHQAAIYGFLRQMTRDEHLAADLTQETFYRAFRGLRRLRRPEAFEGWLYQIARNLVRDHADRPEPVSGGPELLADQLIDPAPQPEADLARRELASRVDLAVASLPADQREAVVLHHLRGLSVETIAGIVGCRPGTVKSRLARGREALRRKLSPYLEVDQ